MSRDSESFSLATTLVDAIRRLAVRVRHASAAAARREDGTPPVLPEEHAEVRLAGATLGFRSLLFVWCAGERYSDMHTERQGEK